uniref:P-type ATPase N-terminal domain-containing protein n=1 Tax=Oncorhynchus mykiss TaxID=8022 RepID=A0A8K9UJ76_ONCMY
MPCCSSPLTLLRDSLRCQRQHDKDLRTLVSNLPYQGLPKTTNRNFPGNSIKTTKYSFWFFIPLNLWEQLHRFANVYFVALIPICVIWPCGSLCLLWRPFNRRLL